jgi:pimeloyl-ACP methyl ester carboxylesterase
VRRGVSIACASALLFAAGSCGTASDDATIAQVDGRRVAYRVLGSGAPVVVMISGMGDGMGSFEDVAVELSKSATVIIYDRAGYGRSTAAPGPRDARAADRELSGLLAHARVPGP